MGKSIYTELRDIRDMVERIANGEFPVRSPIGPGQIQSKNIRARAVTAPLINVDNLEAVNAQTGDLTVDGTITVGLGGKIVSGTDTATWADFTTSPGGGQGYYHTYDATYGALVAFGDFNNVTGQYVKWDGTALSIKGIIVASAGTIAGWTITTDSIENSGGDVGMASSGNGGYAFWAGHATQASAEFSVTAAGALVATTATITGDITASSGSLTGVLTVGGSGGINLSNSGGKIYSGQSVVNTGSGFHLANSGGGGVFSVGNGGTASIYWNGSTLAVSGAITATSGSFTGSVTLGSSGVGGSLSSGQSAYDSGTGFWLERNSGTPRFSIGNSAGNKMTWNGTTLAVTGTVTADAGAIGGWTLSSTTLSGTNISLVNTGNITAGTSNNVVRLSSSDATYRLWVGHATASSAPFRVTSGGAVTATNATISGTSTFSGTLSGADGTFTGSLTAATGSLGSLSIAGALTFGGGGSIALPGTGTITSSTLDLNSGTMSGLTIDGTLTMASGGKILLSSAGRIEDADGSYWDQGGITLVAPTTIGDIIEFRYTTSSFRPHGIIQSYGNSSIAGLYLTAEYGNGLTYSVKPAGQVIVEGAASAGTARLNASDGSNATYVYALDSTTATSSYISNVVHNRDLLRLDYTNYAASFGGYIYPGAAAGSYQSSRHISDLNSRLTLTGQVELASASIGGSAANWSAGSPAGAAYIVVYINGVACRIPFWANA